MSTDVPENIIFTFAGIEYRYSAVVIDGVMVDVRRLLDWVASEARFERSEDARKCLSKTLRCGPDADWDTVLRVAEGAVAALRGAAAPPTNERAGHIGETRFQSLMDKSP